MKKLFKILAAIISITTLLFLIKIFFVHEVQFLPVVRFDDLRRDFKQEEDLVTTWRYASLKIFYPQIAIVKEEQLDQSIKEGLIAIIPWWNISKEYKPLRVSGNYFYDDSNSFLEHYILARQAPVFDENKLLKLIAGGTVVLARGIGKSIDSKKDPNMVWEGTRKLMSVADQAIINFKSPLVYNYTTPNSRWLLRGKRCYADGLTYAGIDIASLSGNHMGDAERKGLLQTISILKEAGVAQAGAGRNLQEAYSPYVWQQQGLTFAFFAFNSVIGSVGKAVSGNPSIENTGVAWLDEDALSAVAQVRSSADVVIVLANWGKEYKAKPTNTEIIWGHRLVEAGADIVIGDQAHWVQNYEFYQGKYIAYGLGNYVFDQYWSEKTKEGILQRYIFYKEKLLSIETIPIKLFWHGDIKVVEDNDNYLSILKQFYGLSD